MARVQRKNLVLLPVPCTPETIRQMDREDLSKAINAGLLPSNRIILNNKELLSTWLGAKENIRMGSGAAPISKVEFVRCMEALADAIDNAHSAAIWSDYDGK